MDALYQQRWLRDLDHVYTPQRWLQSKRVGGKDPGLPAAPSLLILARDWNVLEHVRPTAIADAVYCTEPCDFEAWVAPFRASDAEALATAASFAELGIGN